MFNKKLKAKLAHLERRLEALEDSTRITRVHHPDIGTLVYGTIPYDAFSLRTVVELMLSHLKLDVYKTAQINSKSNLREIV